MDGHPIALNSGGEYSDRRNCLSHLVRKYWESTFFLNCGMEPSLSVDSYHAENSLSSEPKP